MGRAVLKGISTALLVTVLTLIAGMVWSSTGLGVVSVSRLVDIGLVVSCLIGGFRTGRETNFWFFGTLAGAGYVTIGTLILAIFQPVSGLGFLQVMLIGALLGSVAGAFGVGNSNYKAFHGVGRRRSSAYPTWFKPDNWQTVGEDQWTKDSDQISPQVPDDQIIYDQKFNLNSEDGTNGVVSIRPGSVERSMFSKGELEEKRYSEQTGSPWWEEEKKRLG